MEKKILKWCEKGIIDDETAKKLILEVKEEKLKKQKKQFNIAIYTIGIIFLGIGIISFIASNSWFIEILTKIFASSAIVKILLLFVATALSFWGGYTLAYEKKNFPRLGNALIFFSSLLIGATYVLTGQTYNINANNSMLMFLWTISILPIAYIFKNGAINKLSILLTTLGIIFFFNELAIDNIETWTIFIPILCGSFFYTIGNFPTILNKYNDFSFSYKMVGLLPIFATLLILTCSVNDSYRLLSAYYISPIISFILANIFLYKSNSKTQDKLLLVETIFIITILSLMLLLLTCDVPKILVYIIAHSIIIALIVFAYNYGYKFENLKIVSRANNFLIIYLILNYSRWSWSYINKTIFFIIGGILFIWLGIFLETKKNALKIKE